MLSSYPLSSCLPTNLRNAPGTEQMSTTERREFEFFVTTNEPHQPEGPERGLIRRLVMRSFFETKAAKEKGNESALNSRQTVQAKTRLKNRFRLDKVGSGESTKGKKFKGAARRGSAEEENKDGERRATRSESGVSEGSKEERSGTGSGTTSPPEWNDVDVDRGKVTVRVSLKINPSANRFDPFDVLPVPGTQKLDILFKLYKNGSRANSMVINARNTWWPFISNDAGLLHATLATWALYGMLVRGMNDLRVDQLRHKNEAIKEINTKIGGPGGVISDELVGTVSTLASFENLVGAYDAAQLHIAALKRMVNARGGLLAFGHNDGLIRGILWVDFHTATAFRTLPSFPRIRIDPDTPPLPDELLELAAYTSPTSLLQLSVAAIDFFNVFYRLHRLALAASSTWISKVSRLTFSNMLYETEYVILSVPDYSRDFLDFDLEEKGEGGERDETYDERKAAADGASVTEGLLAAAQIFICAALRELPPKAKMFSILLDRLRVALDRPNVSVLDTWREAKNLNMLLWACVVASAVAPAWCERSWWIARVSEAAKELRVKSQKELKRVLERVAWADAFFNGLLGAIWEEMEEYGRALERRQDGVVRERSIEQEDVVDVETVVSGLAEGDEKVGVPMEFQSGRWRVAGWYV